MLPSYLRQYVIMNYLNNASMNIITYRHVTFGDIGLMFNNYKCNICCIRGSVSDFSEQFPIQLVQTPKSKQLPFGNLLSSSVYILCVYYVCLVASCTSAKCSPLSLF